MPLLAAADGELIAAAGAAFGAAAPFVAWVTKKLFAKLTQLVHRFDEVGERVQAIGEKVAAVEGKVDSVGDRVKKIEPIAEVVSKEFLPNGGTSLRDAVDQLRRRAAIMDGILRARFEGDSLATYECGPDGQCTYASAALADLYGLTPDAFIGNGWLKAVRGHNERIRVWHNWLQAVKEGVPYEDVYEIWVDGKALKVRTYTRVVRDDKGRPLCYFGVVTPAPDSKLFADKRSKPDPASPPPPPPPVSNDDDTGEHTPLPAGA